LRSACGNGSAGWKTFGGIILALAAIIPCLHGADTPAPATNVLTSVREVRRLSLETAATRIPVRLEGVITYFDAGYQMAFVQDKTGGIYFKKAALGPDADPVSFGDLVELTGFTRAGKFSPSVRGWEGQPATVRRLATGTLPKPLRPRLPRLLDPSLHDQWVEVIAFLTDKWNSPKRLVLELNTGGLQFQGTLPAGTDPESIPSTWLNRELRLRGVYSALFDNRGQMIGVELFIQNADQIEIAEGNAARLFAEEFVPVEELMRFTEDNRERVRVKGVVVLQIPDVGLYLRGERNGLFVETTTKEVLRAGQSIEAVGRPAPGKFRPQLRDAMVRGGELGPAPEPIKLLPEQHLTGAADAELVRLKARLVGTFDAVDDRVILLQSGSLAFKARLLFDDNSTAQPPLIPGSLLELTGVCSLNAGSDWTPVDPAKPNQRQRLPSSFTLLVAGPGDLNVLRLPSWWTIERVAWLAGGAGLLALLAFGWVALLRHEVRKQTHLLTESVQRESTREERARIARDLHDTLQQNLAAIMLQTNSARKRLAATPERAAEALELAANMARHSLEEVRCTVWNLRAAQLDQAELGEAVRELMASFGQLEKPALRLRLPERACRLPGVVLNHLLNFIREAVTNAIRHARPENITVQIAQTQAALEVTIADDGVGFDTTQANGASTNHFGLCGMRERVAKMKAHHQLTSAPGTGTTIKLTVPLTTPAEPTKPA
jgi:signal transduction histidine kinase